MSFNSTQMIHQLRSDFEQLLALVTGPEAHSATIDQMERSLFRQVLRLGFKVLQLFVMMRVEAEGHTPLVRRDGAVLALASPIFKEKSDEKGIFKQNGTPEEQLVMEFFSKGLPDVLQLGGNATLGKGIVRTNVREG